MKRTLLIVEDDARLRGSLARVLEDGRTEVRAAESALNVLSGWRPALVLSDVRMPGMDGLALMRRRGRDCRLCLAIRRKPYTRPRGPGPAVAFASPGEVDPTDGAAAAGARHGSP